MNNNGGKLHWSWVATILASFVLAMGGWIWNYVNSVNVRSADVLTARVSADEQKIDGLSGDITQIKQDVAYIKGLLQRKYSQPQQ